MNLGTIKIFGLVKRISVSTLDRPILLHMNTNSNERMREHTSAVFTIVAVVSD